MTQKWKQKFIILWLGQGVSVFTSAVIQMAIVWYLTDTTGSAAVLTFATFIGYMPQVLLGPFIGAWIDRYDRKTIMIGADLFIAAVTSILVFRGLFGPIPVWLVMVILFFRSVGAAFHNPSLQAVTPSIVPEEELARYAGYSQGVESVSMLLSPSAAGILYSFLSLNQIILLDIGGAVFAVATLLFLTIPAIRHNSETRTSVLHETRDGLRLIRSEPGLSSLLIVSTLYAVIYFPIGTLFPLICMGYFNGSYVQSGIVETMFSLGMLGGALLLSLLGRRAQNMTAITLSIALYGVGLICSGLLPPDGIRVFMVLALIMGISIPFYRGVKTAIIQAQVEKEFLGRIFALMTSLQTLAMPVGLVLAGSFAEVIGVNRWFLLSGILSVILALVSGFSFVRRS